MLLGGRLWSQEAKQGLLAANSKMILIDALGSSEAIGMGASNTTAAGTVGTGKFGITPTKLDYESLFHPEAAAHPGY